MERHFSALSDRFATFLQQLSGRRLVVIGHARPDGDCIGAQAALARMLRALGHDVVCLNPDPVPRRLAFTVGDTPFVTFADPVLEGREAIYTDCADQARASEAVHARFPSPLGNVDHHLSNQGYGEYNFVDTSSAATCEILAGMYLDLDLPIDATTADALYTGIATDTGQFRFQATTERTFTLAAALVARGARPALAGQELYERETFGKLQLLRHFLASLQTECDGRVCIGMLPDGIYEKTGTSVEDTEGLVDYARCIEGVEIGVLIEVRAGGIKASLRGKNPAYRVDRIAAQFNGGGHACAAGLNVKGVAVEEFRARLSEAIAKQVAAVSGGKECS